MNCRLAINADRSLIQSACGLPRRAHPDDRSPCALTSNPCRHHIRSSSRRCPWNPWQLIKHAFRNDFLTLMYLHSLLKDLPASERELLISRSERKTYRRGETVAVRGERTGQICLVAAGLLRVVVDDDVTTDFIREGDFCLALETSDAGPHTTAALVAALPASVYFIPAEDIWEICRRHPSVAFEFLALITNRISNLRLHLHRVSSLSSEPLITRVLHELTSLAPARQGGYDKRISQEVIASYAALSREIVNKTMRSLELRGLLWKDDHAVYLRMDPRNAPPSTLPDDA
ncbi:Crp/Fnr family transcriptional regulator [Variovorax sp. W2I14]|uniref:Crp/Fnr family transcriptional regulator n=1 Tax=Variovorax sp. W2I14 TaxID=3042290 RepID=UPI003D1A2DB4